MHGTPHRSGQPPWVARPCRDREHALRRTAALLFPHTYKYAILRNGRLLYCRIGRSVPGRVARPAWPAGPDAPRGRRRCARVTARTAGHLELGPNLDVEAVPVGLASTENPGRTENPGTDRSIHGTRPVLLLGSRVEVDEGTAEVVGGEPPARLRVGSASWHSGPRRKPGASTGRDRWGLVVVAAIMPPPPAKPPTSPAREVWPSCRLAPSSGSRPAGPARSTRHAASAPGTRHPAPGTRHPAPGTRHSAPGTRHRPGRPGPTAAGDGTAIPRPPLPGRPPGTGSAVARYGETPVPLLPRSRNPRDTATASGSTAPPPRRAGGRHHRSDLASHGRGGGGVRRTDHRTPARPRLPVARPLIGRHAPARQHAGATPRIGDTTALCQLRVGRPGPPRVTETGLPTTLTRARFQHA